MTIRDLRTVATQWMAKGRELQHWVEYAESHKIESIRPDTLSSASRADQSIHTFVRVVSNAIADRAGKHPDSAILEIERHIAQLESLESSEPEPRIVEVEKQTVVEKAIPVEKVVEREVPVERIVYRTPRKFVILAAACCLIAALLGRSLFQPEPERYEVNKPITPPETLELEEQLEADEKMAIQAHKDYLRQQSERLRQQALQRILDERSRQNEQGSSSGGGGIEPGSVSRGELRGQPRPESESLSR